MAEVSLEEIHQDLEVIKQDITMLKEALLADNGELSDWAKERIADAAQTQRSKFISQKDIEEMFL